MLHDYMLQPAASRRGPAASAWHGKPVGVWCGAVRTTCGRLAGVLLDDGVQREHRQLEHSVGVQHERGMRPSAFGHYAARNRSADAVVALRKQPQRRCGLVLVDVGDPLGRACES